MALSQNNYSNVFLGLEPRGFKSDGTGTIKAFEIQEAHLDATGALLSVSGTITIHEGSAEEPVVKVIPALWNHRGEAFQVNPQLKALMDLVRKVPFSFGANS